VAVGSVNPAQFVGFANCTGVIYENGIGFACDSDLFQPFSSANLRGAQPILSSCYSSVSEKGIRQ
jgi:hypothetical protein